MSCSLFCWSKIYSRIEWCLGVICSMSCKHFVSMPLFLELFLSNIILISYCILFDSVYFAFFQPAYTALSEGWNYITFESIDQRYLI